MDASDSSHSGIVAGATRGYRVGLAGQDAAKKGKFKEERDCLARASQLKVCLGSLEVGDDRGGVTGALFEIRRGGREEGMELQRNANGFDDMLLSRRDRLRKEEEDGLGR